MGAEYLDNTGIFLYSLLLCASSILAALSLLSCILPFVCIYNKNIQASSGIRNRNPRRLAVADLRPGPRGNRDWQGFDPRTFQPVAGRYIGCPILARDMHVTRSKCL